MGEEGKANENKSIQKEIRMPLPNGDLPPLNEENQKLIKAQKTNSFEYNKVRSIEILEDAEHPSLIVSTQKGSIFAV
jgi:hypothetical protein